MKLIIENWNKYIESAETDSIAMDDERRTWQEHFKFKEAVGTALVQEVGDWVVDSDYGWGDIIVPTSTAQREEFLEELNAFAFENTGMSLADLKLPEEVDITL